MEQYDPARIIENFMDRVRAESRSKQSPWTGHLCARDMEANDKRLDAETRLIDHEATRQNEAATEAAAREQLEAKQ